jgi:hypothetical protein
MMNNYDKDIKVDESLLSWNRLSMFSPFMRRLVIQVNTIKASDSIIKINDAETHQYFTTLESGSGPLDDNLKNAVLVLNFEASLDTIINSRVVYKTLDCISKIGGLVVSLLLITFFLITIWNAAFLSNFLV